MIPPVQEYALVDPQTLNATATIAGTMTFLFIITASLLGIAVWKIRTLKAKIPEEKTP